MRIIAGEWKGRVLTAPRGNTTRPTTAHVREALFNILMPRLNGARVLDVFAGSGALSLEALSRGAANAVLCDCDRAAAAAICRNIELLQVSNRIHFEMKDTFVLLERLKDKREQFDIIFLDPPYQRALYEGTLRAIVDGNTLAQKGIIAVESLSKDPPGDILGLQIIKQRRYGSVMLTLYIRGDGQ